MDFALMVLTTIDTKENANRLIKLILKYKLAACIQIDEVESYYIWQGKIDQAKEYRLSIKTDARGEQALIEFIKKNHPYEVPQIIVINVKANAEYVSWLKNI
jgi:periplasmic divalent cation tolerance protein